MNTSEFVFGSRGDGPCGARTSGTPDRLRTFRSGIETRRAGVHV